MLIFSAPIYVVNGAGGNREGIQKHFQTPPPDWSAFQYRGWGYGVLKFPAKNQLVWEFYSAIDNSVVDSFTLTKTL